MSPSLNSSELSSESYGPCSQFIAGAGQNGNRCLTYYEKEWRHHPPSQAATMTATTSKSESDLLLLNNTVQAIIERYASAGNTGMQLRPRVNLKVAVPGPIAAKREAFTGFHKNMAASSAGKVHIPDISKNVSHQNVSRPSPQEKPIKIGTLMMVPHGFTVAKKPGGSELETYHQVGLMVDSDGGNDLEFYTSWSMVNIDTWFQRLLPKPFEWLDAHRGPLKIHWVLLNTERLNFFALTRPVISSKELDEVKGTPGCKFTMHSIAITPRIPIPRSVYSNWNAAIQKAIMSRSTSITSTDADDISEYSESFSNSRKAVVVPTDAELASDSDDSEIQVIAGVPTSTGRDHPATTVPLAAVASTSNTASMDLETSGATAAQSDSTPRVFANLPVNSYNSDSELGAILPVIGTQTVTPAATQALIRVKRAASTAFKTNPSHSGHPSGGKRIKSNNYGGHVYKLGTSELPQPEPTASGSSTSTALLPDHRPSALHPAFKPTQNSWA
ncbi:hypothetical protein V8E55_008710 [Tylopilus felleus]